MMSQPQHQTAGTTTTYVDWNGVAEDAVFLADIGPPVVDNGIDLAVMNTHTTTTAVAHPDTTTAAPTKAASEAQPTSQPLSEPTVTTEHQPPTATTPQQKPKRGLFHRAGRAGGRFVDFLLDS